MRDLTSEALPVAAADGIVAIGVAVAGSSFAQQSRAADKKKEESAPTIDAATGKALNAAIEALNMEKYAEAQAAIDELKMDKLSPYEHSKVEQILFNISYAQDKYDEARGHLQKSIDAGGLNEQEVSQARYQAAQLYLTEEKWKEGAAALEEWFKTAQNPNSAAYYLLAVAYYQLEDYAKALPPAQKAVELMTGQAAGRLDRLLLALYLQKDQYNDAIPLLTKLVAICPRRRPIGCSFRRCTARSRTTRTRSRSCSLRTARASSPRIGVAPARRSAAVQRGAVSRRSGARDRRSKTARSSRSTKSRTRSSRIAGSPRASSTRRVEPLQKGGELAPNG